MYASFLQASFVSSYKSPSFGKDQNLTVFFDDLWDGRGKTLWVALTFEQHVVFVFQSVLQVATLQVIAVRKVSNTITKRTN